MNRLDCRLLETIARRIDVARTEIPRTPTVLLQCLRIESRRSCFGSAGDEIADEAACDVGGNICKQSHSTL